MDVERRQRRNYHARQLERGKAFYRLERRLARIRGRAAGNFYGELVVRTFPHAQPAFCRAVRSRREGGGPRSLDWRQRFGWLDNTNVQMISNASTSAVTLFRDR